jgi:hypothetical protein
MVEAGSSLARVKCSDLARSHLKVVLGERGNRSLLIASLKLFCGGGLSLGDLNLPILRWAS